jgi:hypothetical protein
MFVSNAGFDFKVPVLTIRNIYSSKKLPNNRLRVRFLI